MRFLNFSSININSINTWIFDLDNTLYPWRSGLFNQVDTNMTQYVAQYLQLHLEDARHVQKLLFCYYGTTLRGLMQLYKMPPEPFLSFVHKINLSCLEADQALDHALGRLPGRKMIFTNATSQHSRNILDHLGFSRHFEAIFDIADAQYLPKPDPCSYQLLVDKFALDPAKTIFFDDIAQNLRPAHDLGMMTVHVKGAGLPSWQEAPEKTRFITSETENLADFLSKISPSERENNATR